MPRPRRPIRTRSKLRRAAGRGPAEVELDASEQRMGLAAQAGQVGLWDLDLATGQAWRTLKHDQLFGYAERQPSWGVEEARRHVVPEDREIFQQAFEAALAGARFRYELRIRPADGQLRWLAAEGEVLRDRDGKPVRMVGTVVDVTERKALEARASRAERLAAVATLVRGMSHEVNNPLASVVTNLGYAREQLASARAPGGWGAGLDAPLSDLEEALADAATSADRIRVIVRDMNTFLPHERTMDRRARPEEAAQAALGLAEEELRSCASVTVALDGLPDVAVSREELIQVLFSLLANAGLATGARPNQVRVAGAVSTPGEVTFTVSDTGVGMAPSVLAHLFEPFFTTRGVGQGKGLGLPLCRGVVEAVGGTLTVESFEGLGTTVAFTLPVSGPQPG